MQNTALVLVSCTICCQLHEAPAIDISNPICTHCATAAARRPPVRHEIGPLGR